LISYFISPGSITWSAGTEANR